MLSFSEFCVFNSSSNTLRKKIFKNASKFLFERVRYNLIITNISRTMTEISPRMYNKLILYLLYAAK
jgi:hypothetical protein